MTASEAPEITAAHIALPVPGAEPGEWPTVPVEAIARAVRRLHARATLVPGSVQVNQVGRNPLAGSTGGTWRVAGRARIDGGHPFGWSLVVKRIIRVSARYRSPLWPAARNVEHPMYWHREVDFYNSELPAQLAGPLAAPRCVLTREVGTGSAELWLEDVAGLRPGAAWSLAEYGTAAFHLGEFQGRYLRSAAPAPLPTGRWLSRDWLRWYVKRRHLAPPRPGDLPPSGLIRTLLAHQDVREDFGRMWRDRFWLLDALDALPRTVVHRDFWPPNLFASAGRTTAVDWAYVGIGSVFEDAANFVPDSLLDGYVSPDQGTELDRAVFDGHVGGLRAAGVELPRDLLRFAYVTGASAKYQWILRYMFDLALGRVSSAEPRTPAELDSLFQQRAMVLPRIASYHREALTLARDLGIPRSGPSRRQA